MAVAKYKCGQDAFYILARAGWRLCRKNLPAFAAHKAKYTDEYIDEKLAAIDEVDNLPDYNGRYINYDLTKIALTKCKADFLYYYEILLSYIKDAYKADELDTMYRGAGENILKDAKKGGWTKTTSLMSAAVPFVVEHAAELEVSVKKPTVKDNMPADFPQKLKDIQALYKKLHDDLQNADETGQEQTTEKVELNNALYLDLTDMLDDAASFFKDNAALLDDFNYNNLKKKAQGTKQAGIKGQILVEGAKKGIQNVKVIIVGTDKVCTTDKNGRYNFLQLSPELIQLRIEAEGYETVVMDKVKIKPGIVSRVNIKLMAIVMAMAA